ncbi:MAG: hypothetical protein OXD46_12980 [Chloroflexi bacterium]|nr:hypothetical protein [Chloroflexota bacterium]
MHIGIGIVGGLIIGFLVFPVFIELLFWRAGDLAVLRLPIMAIGMLAWPLICVWACVSIREQRRRRGERREG